MLFDGEFFSGLLQSIEDVDYKCVQLVHTVMPAGRPTCTSGHCSGIGTS